jgi:hypothetical protein
MKIQNLLISKESPAQEEVAKPRKIKASKPNLTNQERLIIYELLKQNSFNGKLPRGILADISERFGVKPRTISRIWHQGQESLRSGLQYPNVCSRIKINSGRKKNSSKIMVIRDYNTLTMSNSSSSSVSSDSGKSNIDSNKLASSVNKYFGLYQTYTTNNPLYK